MPKKFVRTGDSIITGPASNAVKRLRDVGVNKLADLNLTYNATDSSLMVPADQIVLMMGKTKELTDELAAQSASNFGIEPEEGVTPVVYIAMARVKHGLALAETVVALFGSGWMGGANWPGWKSPDVAMKSTLTFDDVRESLKWIKALKT